MLSVGLGTSSWALGISVAAFTLLSGLASLLLLILYIRNGQKFNYLSLLALAISLDKFNSFAQQLYSLFNFREIQLKAYNLAIEYFNCRGTESLPLFSAPDDVASVFIHIQNFLINAEGLLFFYWSLILFSSAWNLSPSWWKNKNVIVATKISCLLVPALQLGLLRVPMVRDSDLANLMVMNVVVLVNMGMSSVFLLLTLLYIISIQRETCGATEVRLSKTYDGVVEFRPKSHNSLLLEKANGMVGKSIGGSGIVSDGWVIGRIALAFFMVEGLQVYVIAMQIFFLHRWAHFKSEWQQGLSAPAINQAEEFANICSPIPSSFTGFLFLLVFGTTREARNQFMTIIKDTWYFLTMRSKKRVFSLPDIERTRPQKRGSITARMYGIPESTASSSTRSSFSILSNSTSTASSVLAQSLVSPTISQLGKTLSQERSRDYGLRIITEPEPTRTRFSWRCTDSAPPSLIVTPTPTPQTQHIQSPQSIYDTRMKRGSDQGIIIHGWVESGENIPRPPPPPPPLPFPQPIGLALSSPSPFFPPSSSASTTSYSSASSSPSSSFSPSSSSSSSSSSFAYQKSQLPPQAVFPWSLWNTGNNNYNISDTRIASLEIIEAGLVVVEEERARESGGERASGVTAHMSHEDEYDEEEDPERNCRTGRKRSNEEYV